MSYITKNVELEENWKNFTTNLNSTMPLATVWNNIRKISGITISKKYHFKHIITKNHFKPRYF